MKRFLIILTCMCLLSGCSSALRHDKQEIKQNVIKENVLMEKLESLSFEQVSDYYLRNVKQDGADIAEMFITGEDSFVRITMNDDEEEVFSYNYISDEFCYLYCFSDEQVAKVVYNIGNDKVIEDKHGFIDLVKNDAIELKEYFNSLIEIAGISIEELC